MNKPWNDSDLARLSADLDEELNAIFDQVEAALTPPDDPWAGEESAEMPSRDIGPTWERPDPAPQPTDVQADLETEEAFLLEDLDMDAPLGNGNIFPVGQSETETGWLEPGLLGDPEISGELTPETTRELSRIIETAVEKGVAAALAKIKG